MVPWQEEQTQRRGWFSRLHLSWPMLFVAGWLLYEFTAQPGLGALVACAKFGWGDVRAAFWLRRVDPDRWRGKTCFWAYLSYGLWKIAITATLTMILIGFFSAIFNRPPPQQQANNNALSPVLGGALAAALVGFSLSFPTAYIALWSAWRNGVRIWLGGAPNRARKERFWPPHHRGINAAPFVGFTLLIMTIWLTVLSIILLLVILQPNGMNAPYFVMGILAALILVMYGHIRLYGLVFASTPQECWPLEGEEMIHEARKGAEGKSEA